MTILETVSSPADLRALDGPALRTLAAEIREFLVGSVADRGGHLGPNLGVVELTIALHRVFDSPSDPLLFDTGHQTYVHKILTGRRDLFGTLRQHDGLSGYPSRSESPHDWTESSHGSASLSYADGLATAFEITGQSHRCVVAVIGDGALTGGMAWEALNNIAAGSPRRIVIVVNDNGRSYAPTVGGVARNARRIFGDLGLTYLGPVDGHDLPTLETTLRRARDHGGPVVVHTVTEKGHGYPPASGDMVDHMHCTGVMDPVTGAARDVPARQWTDVFAEELVAIGGRRADIVAVTAAMAGPTGLSQFAAAFPGRTFDVGIAEQHAVTSAAGLALGGLHPVVAVYSTFLNRGFDQILMDVALLRLPVTFVLDRAGITGPDGPSHHGIWDLSVTGVVPGIRVAAPRDGVRLAEALDRCMTVADGPTVIRFPKGRIPDTVPALSSDADLDTLGASDVGSGIRILVVNFGAVTDQCSAAFDALTGAGHRVTVVDPRWVTPVASSLVSAARDVDLVITVEDNGVHGGAGQRLHRELVSAEVDTPVRYLAVDQKFPAHGTRAELLAEAGLDSGSVAARVIAWADHLRIDRGDQDRDE